MQRENELLPELLELPRIHIVEGRDAIAAHKPLLVSLAARCGQTGEADQVPYFLSTPDALKKIPALVLLYDEVAEGAIPMGAVLLFEYKTILGRTRIFASADGTGRRSVIAPPEMRATVAALAAQALVKRGAEVVHLAFNQQHLDSTACLSCGTDPTPEESDAIGKVSGALESRRLAQSWALEVQAMPMYLPLLSSFDKTLARIGQRTRSNLRYYRRRCELQLGSSFVAEVAIGEADFLRFNRSCTYAVTDQLARGRLAALGAGTFLCGIRDGEGDWLALVGGRRQNDVVEIDWQMNRADRPQHSLSTVVRSYIIEAEIARGTRRLYIEGGTPHPIRWSFVQEQVHELTLKRRSLYVWALGRFGRWMFPEKNYVGSVLQRRDIRWRKR